MVLVLLAVPALSLLFLQNRQVQTMVSKFVAERLSDELQASITLSSVNYSFFKRIQVRDLYVEDPQGDTLLYSELTKLRIKQLRSDRKGIEIKKISLENAYVNFVIDSTNVVNLSFIVDLLKKPHVPPEKKTRLHIASIELVDSRFSLSRMIRTPATPEVNFTDLVVNDLNITVDDLISSLDTVRMQISSLSCIEKSGFKIGQFTSHLSAGKTHLIFSDLGIVTEGSDLHVPVIGFNFENYKKFRHFSREVDLTFRSEGSLLEMADLSYFVRGTSGILDHIAIDGNVHGKLSHMKGEELFVTFDQNSTLAFDFVMIGLPEVNNTFLDFHFRELNTSFKAVHELMGQVKEGTGEALYPWKNLGNLDFNGQFTGYFDNFVAAGLLNTDMGRMVMDLSFKPDTVRGVDFNGRLRTRDFRLGEFLNQEETLEQLDMNVFADGNLYRGQIEADLKGTIDTLEILKYSYSNIMLDGAFTNNTFDGGISISDPNIKMDFLGRMDFSGEVPLYNFTADVARARPYFLKLVKEDPNSFASFLIETNISGKTVDEMNGEVRLVNSLFQRKDAQLQLYDMTISTRNTADTSLLQIRSEMFDGSIEGQYKLSKLPASFQNLADQFLDIMPNQEPQTDMVNHFVYQVDFKRMNPVLDFFFPLLQIGKESHAHGQYKPSEQICTTNGFFQNLQIGQIGWSNVDLFSEIRNDEFQVHFQSDSMTYGKSYSLTEHKFSLYAANDTAHLDAAWDNRIEPRYTGDLKLMGTIVADSLKKRNFRIDILPTNLYINDALWKVSSSNILLRKQYIHMDSLSISSEEKYLVADGTISSVEEQDFDLELQNLNLAELSSLAGINVDLMGNITGNINYQQMEGNPTIFSDLAVDTLHFNQQLLGPTTLNATWNDAQKSINMKLLSETGNTRVVEMDGTFTPGSNLLDFDIHLNEFELEALNPYAENVVSNLDGKVNVSLTLDGNVKKPELNGVIEFMEGAATFSFLNTRYIFNDQIRIYNNNFYLEKFMASDELGNRAHINGTISNNHFKDFYTNINIEADNLLCMNTQSKDNEVFYGTIHATGNIGVRGSPDEMKLNVKATTERNTAIFLPLYNASEVQTSDFITFIQKTDVVKEQFSEQLPTFGGVEMELEVDITPDAVVQLIFDPKVGDIIETSGRGNLRIMLDQGDGFRMFGDVELLKGDYLFTLQNVINKRFQIEPGGRINFNGTPTNAAIDLNAIYTTRAAPYNLYPGSSSEAPESLKKRIPVDCHLFLKGELQAPTISTGIEMPTADPETRDLLENSTSTEEELMKQFLSLLVINNFYSISGYGTQNVGTMNSSIAGVTASELLSNQLSNWLSQISDDFDIGVNYRPSDQISSDELEVALSTQLLDDRVIISGNVDVGGQEMNPSEASNNPYFVGDFDVEFKVTNNISVIAFNRARDELLFETAPYKQGVGVSYREEFDDLGQLLTRYREGLTNRKKKKRKSGEPEPED
ncbi:MAG: translocation/assembly module TamB domain-containing protein [Bacteroidota bacterium]